MTSSKRFTYSEPTISAKKSDETNNFVWIAYEQDTDNNCNIKKLYGFDLDQVFFSIDKSVDKIVDIDVDGTNVYLAYEDSTLLGEILDQGTPVATTTDISMPSGITITEFPVAIVVNGTDLYFLLPGSASSTNAKILKYNTDGIFQDEIDLTKSGATVTNATSLTVDANNDIWVVTNNSPAEYVRVQQLSGGIFDFTIFETT